MRITRFHGGPGHIHVQEGPPFLLCNNVSIFSVSVSNLLPFGSPSAVRRERLRVRNGTDRLRAEAGAEEEGGELPIIDRSRKLQVSEGRAGDQRASSCIAGGIPFSLVPLF